MTRKKLESRLEFWREKIAWNPVKVHKITLELKLDFAENKRKHLLKKLNGPFA